MLSVDEPCCRGREHTRHNVIADWDYESVGARRATAAHGGVRLGWIEKMSVVGACKQTTAGNGGRVGCTRAPETTLLWRVESPGRGAGQRW